MRSGGRQNEHDEVNRSLVREYTNAPEMGMVLIKHSRLSPLRTDKFKSVFNFQNATEIIHGKQTSRNMQV
jgi:hypothetical protein